MAKQLYVPGVSSTVGAGWLVLAAAVLVLWVCAKLLVVGPRPAFWSILALIGGVVVTAIGVYNLFSVTSLVPDPRTDAERDLAQLVNDPASVGVIYNARIGFGLYVVVAGGLLAAIGALAWLFTDRWLDAAPEQPPRPGPPAPLLAAGAIVGAIGAFLPWGRVTLSSSNDEVNQSFVHSGAAHLSVGGANQGSGSWLVLGGALLALIAAVSLFDRGRAWWAVAIGLLAGLVMAGVGLYDLFVGTKKLTNAMNQAQQQPSPTGLTPDQTSGNFVDVSPSVGLYVLLLGAVLAVIGAVFGLRDNRG